MARKMNPEKPGVMIYFSAMRKEAHDLDDARLGRLFRAILDFSDPESPECGTDPDFGDETLNHVWNFVRDVVDRDDATYTEKSLNRKYSNYCRWSRENNAYIVEREEWRNAGCPTFVEVKKRLVQMDPTGSKWSQMDFFYSIWNTISSPPANTNLSSSANPNPVLAPDAARRETAEPPDEPPSAAPVPTHAYYTLSPSLQNALTEWQIHWEQTTGRTLPLSSRYALIEDFHSYSEEYGTEAVLRLVKTSVSSAYKSIPWDRLERERRKAASDETGGQNPIDELREVRAQFLREESES